MAAVTHGRRAPCSVCDREMRLKADGTIGHHGGPVAPDGRWREYRCRGAGEPPVGQIQLDIRP